jgi:hypothetical protein
MLKSKPLWWTCLAIWILGAINWHICQIKQLCDQLPATGIFSERLYSYNYLTGPRISAGEFQININLLIQYSIMLLVTFVLGFFTARSYETRKTRELKYKLNQISRELAFSKSKQ